MLECLAIVLSGVNVMLERYERSSRVRQLVHWVLFIVGLFALSCLVSALSPVLVAWIGRV